MYKFLVVIDHKTTKKKNKTCFRNFDLSWTPKNVQFSQSKIHWKCWFYRIPQPPIYMRKAKFGPIANFRKPGPQWKNWSNEPHFVQIIQKMTIFYTTHIHLRKAVSSTELNRTKPRCMFEGKQQSIWSNISQGLHYPIAKAQGSLHQYIPLKTGLVRHMLAPCSSYSAFVWQACIETEQNKFND